MLGTLDYREPQVAQEQKKLAKELKYKSTGTQV
jgi:hypothetical protein